MIDFENLAENYLSCADTQSLKKIIKNGEDIESLKDWLNSELNENINNSDVEEFNNCIIGYAEYIINEDKQNAIYELRNSIDSAIDNYCEVLEDYELAAIFAEYVTTYLKNEF